MCPKEPEPWWKFVIVILIILICAASGIYNWQWEKNKEIICQFIPALKEHKLEVNIPTKKDK